MQGGERPNTVPKEGTPMVAGPVAWMPQHLPPLPPFTGEDKTDGEDIFEDWLEQLELVSALLEWDESTRLVHLVT